MTLIIHPSPLLAHELGAPFSGAIIDPPILHHAHIENEQRLNFFSLRGVEDVDGRKRSAYEAELELAYGSRDYRYGFELFIPVSNFLSPDGSGRVTGLGDLEIRPLKYAFVMKPDFVLSSASAFGLPTGSEEDGLGEGNTSFTQLLFVDKAQGNWGSGVNLGLGGNLHGDQDVWFEYGLGLSYSFIRGVNFSDMAPARPTQNWVISPSAEFVGRRDLSGLTAGEDTASLVPGLTFWHVQSGWQIRVGIGVPVYGEREAGHVFLFQIGNHLSWRALFGRKSPEANLMP